MDWEKELKKKWYLWHYDVSKNSYITCGEEIISFIKSLLKDQMEELEREDEPYFGWCDVEGCENEGCSGGNAWRKTGYWTVCYKHANDFRDDKPQPKMKQEAIGRENSRDKITGCLKLKEDKL